MTMSSRNLREIITHWPFAGSDGFGGFTFGTPIALEARWELKRELFMTAEGEEVVSNAIVYLSADVDEGDYLAQGDQTTTSNPGTLSNAFRIKAFGKATDLRSLDAVRKAWL